MSRERDTTDVVRAWLRTAAAELNDPDFGLDQIISQLSTTPQRRRWWTDRWSTRGRGVMRSDGVPGDRDGRRSRRMFGFATVLMAGAVGAAALVAGISQQEAGPRTIVVAQDDSGDATTIAEGVAMAIDGDTVLVRPGVYPESVVIAADITLTGDGDEGEVVLRFAEGGPAVPSWTFAGDIPYGFLIVDAQTTVSDLTVNGPNVGVGFALVGGAPTLERVVVDLDGEYQGRPHVPFLLLNLAAATIRDSRGMGGLLWGEFDLAAFESVRGTGRLTIERNVIDQGISVRVSDGSLVADNTVNGYISLVEIVGGGAAVVARNDASNFDIGADATGLTVQDNTFHGEPGTQVGIAMGAGAPLIEGNAVVGMEVAIQVPLGASPSIISNQITDNTTGIMVAGAETVPIILGNTFCGNGSDLAVADGSPLTLDGNTVCAEGASPAL